MRSSGTKVVTIVVALVMTAFSIVSSQFKIKDKHSVLVGKQEKHISNSIDRLPLSIESYQTPPQILANRGYPTETHRVVTEDGYIIELHRIPPRTKGKRAILLQHGVFESSGTWLVNPSSRSLPCLLSNLGYDVWIGNARGNRFSRSHVTLDPQGAEYWDFGWDEVGKFDIPAVIKYILKISRLPKLVYVGHSMGGAVFYIAMITHPELNDKIDMMVGLAPLSAFRNTGTPISRWSPFVRKLQVILKLLGVREFIDNQGLPRRLLRKFCEQSYSQARACLELLNALVLHVNFPNLDLNYVPNVNSNFMMGTSVQVIVQFAQHINAGQVFQAYDYGRKGNLERYGTRYPFQYNLTKVTAPAYIFYGTEDNIVAPADIEWMLSKLGNVKYTNLLNGYGHMDFIWGIDVKERVYNPLIALLPPP